MCVKPRILSITTSIIIMTLASLGQAQNQRTVRWERGQPNSSKLTRPAEFEQLVVKELKVDGITITASVRDGFGVELSITNDTQRSLEIKPEKFALEVVKPHSRLLSYQSPDLLARAAQNSASVHAGQLETSGSMATKTVVETTTTWSDSPFLWPPNSPSEPPHLITNTTINTVPDDDARWRAQMEASSIRNAGDLSSQGILRSALRPITLTPGGTAFGAVFFKRDPDAKEVLLRLPLANLMVEIPFSAVKKRFFLWMNVIHFE